MPRRCVGTLSGGELGGPVEQKPLPDLQGQMTSLKTDPSTFNLTASLCEGEPIVSEVEQQKMWESTNDSLLRDDEGISFPLSQPDPPSRQQQLSKSSSVQRRRRSAACCSAPYIASGQQHQRLIGPLCAALGSGVGPVIFSFLQSLIPPKDQVRRQHTPPRRQRSLVGAPLGAPCEDESPTAGEAERVAREMAEAAIASAHALAADAKTVDPAYITKPTAFLYKGHTAQIATSTAGMYGEMIESFIKQVVAYARQYGADQFSVFCDLGSGRGAPSAIAAYEHDWLACLGIEKCPQAFSLSLETQQRLLLREASDRLLSLRPSQEAWPTEGRQQASEKELKVLFETRPRRAVAFAHDDLSAYVDLEGVTHAYSFDAAMEGPLINYITQMFMETETWWFYLSFRNDLITRFDLKGAEIKHQISSSMWVSSEGRTAYVYVKTDWKERQQKHRQWLREKLLGPQLHQQAKQQRLLRHVRIHQQLVLQQLQLQSEDDPTAACPRQAASAAESPVKTPVRGRRSSMSPVGTPRCRSNSRRRQSEASESQQQQQQQMVLFHLAARRQQLQVLNEIEPTQSIWGNPREEQQLQQQQQKHHGKAADAPTDRELLEQLRSFRSTHLRLSKWHQPLTVRSLLLVSLLPFEGQNQWLQLQRQLLQPTAGVLTRAQRLLLLGYDENQRKEEELARDKWLEHLAASARAEETKALRADIRVKLTEQRREDMSLFSFLPPDADACTSSGSSTALPDGASLRLGFRHSLQELQERQSPMRTPPGRGSCARLASKDFSPMWRAVPTDAAVAAHIPGQQQLVRQQQRSPVHQPARRRTSSHSICSASPRRRGTAALASAVVAAADAAATASPVKSRGRVCGAVGTPNGRRAVQKIEKELQGLDFSGDDAACDSCIAFMSQDAP